MDRRLLTSAVLGGRSKFGRFREEFQQKWNGPAIEAQVARSWKMIASDPVVKQALTERAPEAVEKMDRMFGGV